MQCAEREAYRGKVSEVQESAVSAICRGYGESRACERLCSRENQTYVTFILHTTLIILAAINTSATYATITSTYQIIGYYCCFYATTMITLIRLVCRHTLLLHYMLSVIYALPLGGVGDMRRVGEMMKEATAALSLRYILLVMGIRLLCYYADTFVVILMITPAAIAAAICHYCYYGILLPLWHNIAIIYT